MGGAAVYYCRHGPFQLGLSPRGEQAGSPVRCAPLAGGREIPRWHLGLRIPNRRLARVRSEKGCCMVGHISHDSPACPGCLPLSFSGGRPLSRSVAGVGMGMFRLSPEATCPPVVLPSLSSAIHLRLRHRVLENNRIEQGGAAIGIGKKGKVKISSTESLGAGQPPLPLPAIGTILAAL